MRRWWPCGMFRSPSRRARCWRWSERAGRAKTTPLRCLAGLETPDEPDRIGARDVFSARDGIDVPTEQRHRADLQSYALWPHLTVERNVAYPLERRNLPDAERKSRV